MAPPASPKPCTSRTIHSGCFAGEGTFFGQNLQGSNSLGQSIYCDSFETGLMMGQPTILVCTSCLQPAKHALLVVQCGYSPEVMEFQQDAYHCSLQAGSLCSHCLQVGTGIGPTKAALCVSELLQCGR